MSEKGLLVKKASDLAPFLTKGPFLTWNSAATQERTGQTGRPQQRLTTFLSTRRLADIRELTKLAEDGQLKPLLDQSYPLAEAPQAVD